MGETGCGKTKLIKVLNQLLNNGQQKLKILNIEPSYKDQDLIKEMDEINKKSVEYGNDEFWIFFDELNTCLISICNPYRKKKKGLNICGLTYDNTHELVY